MSPAKARIRTARSGVERTSHEATARFFNSELHYEKPFCAVLVCTGRRCYEILRICNRYNVPARSLETSHKHKFIYSALFVTTCPYSPQQILKQKKIFW